MLKFRFNKLVRDKIVDRLIATDAKPKYRILNRTDHIEALVEKIVEEAKEILGSKKQDLVSELGDVQQAINDLENILGISADEVEKARKLKCASTGSFKKGIYVDYVEIDEKDKWVKYFKDNSDRYPVID